VSASGAVMKMRTAWGYRSNFKGGRTAVRREAVTADFTFSVIEGNVSKKLPHIPDRWVRLGQVRMLQVNLRVVGRDFTSSDLGDRVPTFVLLFPAILIA
jgi:hypothetical protein